MTFVNLGTGVGIRRQTWTIVDQKTAGTAGGSFTASGWRTRDLNTTIGTNTIDGASLSSNQITLPAGTYRIYATCPAWTILRHKAKLRNITDSTDTIIGSSELTGNVSGGDMTCSVISGIFTIASTKTFEIQHYSTQTRASDGFGSEINIGVVEVYTQVFIERIN